MLTFKATDEQLRQIGANAANAAIPMGMGYLQYDARRTFAPDDAEFEDISYGLHLDYVQGRMTKLRIRPDAAGRRPHGCQDLWNIRDDAATPDYQSWVSTYPTYQALVESVEGVEIVPAEEQPNAPAEEK